jgi:DNA-binding beta-propeller fold protein YncE
MPRPAGTAQVSPRDVRVPGEAFASPDAIAADRARVWVANNGGNSVTELSAATGALIRVISGQRYQLNGPVAISANADNVWVANAAGNSLTEINAATGALIRVISGKQFQLNGPQAITAGASHVWVADATGNSLTEINAATGALIRVISAPRYQLNGPQAVTADATHVWVASGNSKALTEINAVTGALIRVMSLPDVPFAITANGAAVWLVINVGAKSADGSRPHGSVIEVDSTGRLVRTLSSPPFADSDQGGAVASAGNQLWVTDSRFLSNGEGWVTELSPATGALIRLISG